MAYPSPLSPAEEPDDLGLLSTNRTFNLGMFGIMRDTSAATALASRMCAQVLSAYPELRPETVRALMIHSAEWTGAMRERLPANASRADFGQLLGRYGYGVPNLGRAKNSIENDVTMVVESELQPFYGGWFKGCDKRYDAARVSLASSGSSTTRQHTCRDEGNAQLFYRAKSRRTWVGFINIVIRHMACDFLLRAVLKQCQHFSAGLTKSHVKKRSTGPEALAQLIQAGISVRDIKIEDQFIAIHGREPAVDLAAKNAIGVCPVGGWWKEKPALRRAERRARYSLIVSLVAPTSTEVDLYTPIATQVSPEVEIEI